MIPRLPKLLVGTSLVLLLGLLSCIASLGDSVDYQRTKTLGVLAHVVTVDLRDPGVYVTIGLPERGVGHSESFRMILRRKQPAVAITGTFFDTRSLKPVGDLVIGGTLAHTGSVGTGLAINYDNEIKCVPLKIGRNSNWQAFETVLCAGPRLVSGGVVSVDPRAEGFRDRHLFGRHRRPAAGITASGKLLLVCAKTPVTFSELAKVMRRLGAIEAVGLDGGSSMALYYDGKVVVSPGRSLTNVLLVYTDQLFRAEMAKERARLKQARAYPTISAMLRASEGLAVPLETAVLTRACLGPISDDLTDSSAHPEKQIEWGEHTADIPPRIGTIATGKEDSAPGG